MHKHFRSKHAVLPAYQMTGNDASTDKILPMDRLQREAEAARRDAAAFAEDKQRLEYEMASMRVSSRPTCSS